MPIFKAFATACSRCMLPVCNGGRCILCHWRLKSVVPRMCSTNGSREMFFYMPAKSLFSLSSRMINSMLAKRNMPKEMPDLFQFQHRKSVFNVVQIATMNSLPIYQLDPTFLTNTLFVLSNHFFSRPKTVESAVAISICATDI